MAVAGVFTVGTIYPAAIPALIVLAAVLCFSRVYLGVHYLGDVLGGAALGLAGGILWVLLVPAPL
jgi:membrane-associated phospholipid phosphatase